MFFASAEKAYKYFIDDVSLTHVVGWAMHKKHDKPCHVVLKTTKLQVVAEGTTSIARPDIQNRRCGFRLPVAMDLRAIIPGRFLLFIDGVKVADCYLILPVNANMVDGELAERTEALVALRTERLEREVEMLTRKLAELNK